MNTTVLFLSIIPLIAFVIIDSFAGLKAGLITAIILAIAEVIFSFVYFGEIDWITWLSLALVVVMGYISYKNKTALHFKLQPVVLSIVFGLVLLMSYFFGKPLLYEMAIKYAPSLPEQQQQILAQPMVQQHLKVSTSYLGVALFFHAALTCWAAFKLSNWWWIVIRGVGFYGFAFIAMLLARLSL